MARVGAWLFLYVFPIILLIVFGATSTGALLFTFQTLCLAPALFTWVGYSMGRAMRGRRLRVVFEP